MRTELPISQSFGIPDSYYSGVITRDPQGTFAINEQLTQTIFEDRWIFRIPVVSRNRDRSYLTTPTVVCKPHSTVFGLRQCGNPPPDRSGKCECFRTAPQEGNDPHGRYPERAFTIDEQVPYYVRSKVPVVPDWDPSCAFAQDQPGFGASPDSSVMIASEAMNLRIRQFFRSGKQGQRTVSQET